MRYASVIVDLKVSQTDRSFDYEIPHEWRGIIKPGMRVVVPFGSRKLQGFVVEVKDESAVKKVKAIDELLDPTPVLNEELLKLGEWLTESTLCFKITAFQAMLPSALKANYQKELLIHKDRSYEHLHPDIQTLFQKNKKLDLNKACKSPYFHVIQKEIEAGNLEVQYVVKQKTNKRTIKQIKAIASKKELQAFLSKLPKQANKQKRILQFFIENDDPIPLKKLLEEVQCTVSSVKTLIDKKMLLEEEVEVYRDPYEKEHFEKTNPLPLTNEQTKAIQPILASLEKEQHDVFLMYGVTGSGKTEIYLQAIEEVLKKGKEAIVLVPEISLTPQMVQRFKGRFGSKVAVLHSGLSTGEKYDEWRKIDRGEVKLVVGARSAIFAPFQNIGIIIIDEEHETSYKQEENPRYHAREVAIYRGKYHSCPVVLGSATPTLESYARAQKGVYNLLTLTERVNKRPLPTVEIVDMREELRKGNRTMFSESLYTKLKNRLENGEQAVLFLNKRGYSSFVMCRDCGFVISCPHCDISLTYHRFDEKLKCHYCGYEEMMPPHCPDCKSKYIRFFGTGTQRVEEEIAKVLPEARVIRMDNDTTSRKGAHEKLLKSFGRKEADILLGTQMIAKGLDFQDVTLVGVLTADTMLHLPDFRASEKTFQLLTQVSGRAGRHTLPGEVVIQTYVPEHYSIQLAQRHDYALFFQKEMYIRKLHHYPPYYYLVLITVSHQEVTKALSTAEHISLFMKKRLSDKAQILGPVSSPIPRINDRYRYQCMIKYKRESSLYESLKAILKHYQQEMNQTDLTISIDLNPLMLM
ncbi:primosomal protein N' [Aeribacillus alveayuensis]|uniref:Replication restart protein PriA n=1 Tax=Aeribacillus alveayuensis TaxID=279215 RepID=A0ABT9VL52_9BACI|nr:primosomal protein N' (replication factor Y) [Bacillus alveayuensis]